MIISDTYKYLDFNGNSQIPNLSSVLQDRLNGIVNIVILDNNICQNLALYFNDKNKIDPKTRNKIENFLVEIDISNVDVCAAFGILELSSNRETLKIDNAKFYSYGQAVMAALKLPQYNLTSGLSSFFINTDDNNNDIFPFMPLLTLFYTHLLKIKIIENHGLNKSMSFKNVKEYLEWANKIQGQTIFPTQVAFALFGGEPKARKIVKIEKNKHPLQSVWGAAWDMMYLFIVQQFSVLTKNEQNNRLLFATNDDACWLIGSLFKLRGAIKNKGNVELSFGEVSIDFPHYRDKINELKKMNEKIKLSIASRLTNKPDPNERYKELIKEKNFLEKEFLKLYEVSIA